MSARAEVPEGCVGIDFPDGSRAHGRGDGEVRLSDRQTAMVHAVGGDVKVVGMRVAVSDAGPWRDCETCPRSFFRSITNPAETRCPRCRGN